MSTQRFGQPSCPMLAKMSIGETLVTVPLVLFDNTSIVPHLLNGCMRSSRARRRDVQEWDCSANSAFVEHRH